MKIRIASTLLALALPLVAQEPASSQVEATFYKAFYLEKGPRRFEEASALYTKFLAAAPEHKLAKEAAKQQFRLLDRLGKSKERDAFKAKYSKLLGNISAGGTRTRPQRGGDAGGRPGRGEGNDRGGRGGRGERGDRGGRRGGRRGGVFGMLRGDSKISEMNEEQLAELKTGLEGAPEMIERMGRFLGEEAAAALLKNTEAMKKALDAGKTEEAQKALDAMRKSMGDRMGRGRGGRGGDAGGRGRGGRGGEEGGRGGRGGNREGGRGGNREGGGGGRGGNREGGGGGGRSAAGGGGGGR